MKYIIIKKERTTGQKALRGTWYIVVPKNIVIRRIVWFDFYPYRTLEDAKQDLNITSKYEDDSIYYFAFAFVIVYIVLIGIFISLLKENLILTIIMMPILLSIICFAAKHFLEKEYVHADEWHEIEKEE